MSNAYQALVRVSNDIGWPVSFRTDLTKHDRGALKDWGDDQPFAWCLREDGTHLVHPDARYGVHQHKRSWDFARCIQETFRGCRWFVWRGRPGEMHAQAMTFDEVIVFLREHVTIEKGCER